MEIKIGSVWKYKDINKEDRDYNAITIRNETEKGIWRFWLVKEYRDKGLPGFCTYDMPEKELLKEYVMVDLTDENYG